MTISAAERLGSVVVLLDAGGNAAAVVLDRHRAVGVERDVHSVAVAGQTSSMALSTTS